MATSGLLVCLYLPEHSPLGLLKKANDIVMNAPRGGEQYLLQSCWEPSTETFPIEACPKHLPISSTPLSPRRRSSPRPWPVHLGMKSQCFLPPSQIA